MSRLLICGSPDTTGINCCETPYPYIVPDCVEACVIDAIRPHIDPVLNDLANAVRFGLLAKCVSYERRAQDLANLRDILIQSFRDRMRLFYAGSADLTMAQVFENYGIACALEYFRNRYKIDITSILFAAGIYRPGKVLSSAEQGRLAIPSNMLCAPVPDTIYPVTLPVFPPIPPLEPCELNPDFIVESIIDSADIATAPPGTYLVTTGDPIVVGMVVTDGTIFTMPNVGTLIHDLATDIFWIMTSAGVMPFLTTLTLTLATSGYDLTSAYPAQTAAGTRIVLVYGTVGVTQVLLYAGPESGIPAHIDTPYFVSAITVTYSYNGCPYVAPGIVVNTVVEYETDCTGLAYPTYRYNSIVQGNLSWAYATTAPGETLTFTFLAGGLDPAVVITFYDGPDNLSPVIAFVSGQVDLTGISVPSTGSQMFVEITSAPDAMEADMVTWLWQIGCASGFTPPAATVAVQSKCDEYVNTITLNITSLGDGATVGVQYSVDGDPPVTILGLGLGVLALGSFPYNSVVTIILLHPDSPITNVYLGAYTNNGSCPNTSDPCSPAYSYKINQIGDSSERPVDPGINNYNFLVYTITEPTSMEVGELYVFDNFLNTWSLNTYNPGVITDGTLFVYSTGPGVQPYSLFPLPTLMPLGSSPLNWQLYMVEISVNNILTNRPIKLQVRNGMGPWVDSGWDGTEQDLAIPLDIQIDVPFTNARIVWNWDTCGYLGGVSIIPNEN